MSTYKPYVKRHIQTFAFKGRKRRGLLWTKSVYKEWFEFALLSNTYPADFGQLNSFKNFEEWWKHQSYGFELFCEPPEGDQVIEMTGTHVSLNKELLTLAIDLDCHPEKLISRIRNIIGRKQKNMTFEVKSNARYQPSRPKKHIKIKTIERYRHAYTLQKKGLKRYEIGEELQRLKFYDQEPYLREISRDIQNAKKILKNVEKGIFP